MSVVDSGTVQSAWLKAELLSHGVVPTDAFLRHYGPPFLEKRRAYGNPDDARYWVHTVPQELYILPARLICAVNIRPGSPWQLDCDGATSYFVFRADAPAHRVEVTFPLRPAFYNMDLPTGGQVQRFVTLYGGGSLGVFVYGRCAMNDMGAACQFCSLAPNRSRQTEFPQVLRADQIRAGLEVALGDKDSPITQVMINGGNFSDLDDGFRYYVDVVRAARKAIDAAGRQVELHLIVGPPRDVALVRMLRDLDVSVAMNLEVSDPVLFARYCPGKHQKYGQNHIRRALAACVDHLGAGRVHSIFVGGLEPVDSLSVGMAAAASQGITPIVNVFHPDPDTPLAHMPSPSPAEIVGIGAALQALFTAHGFMKPFYLDCGRNSLDTEASRGLFAKQRSRNDGTTE